MVGERAKSLKKRLAVYHRDTAPLLDYYRSQGKLETVDGMAPVEAVTKAISVAISARSGKGAA